MIKTILKRNKTFTEAVEETFGKPTGVFPPTSPVTTDVYEMLEQLGRVNLEQVNIDKDHTKKLHRDQEKPEKDAVTWKTKLEMNF